MIAHFYILPESFENNINLSDSIIEEKIKRLAEDIGKIYLYKDTNKIYINFTQVYSVKFLSNYTVGDIFGNPYEAKQKIDRDVVNAILKIFQQAKDTNITYNEIYTTLLPWFDENECNGIIAFHKITGIKDELQLIYGIDGWYKFRRHFLGLYPKDSDYFISECKIYYPNLYFHDRIKKTIKSILNDSSKKIVHYLAELNDKYISSKTNPYDRKSTLKNFNTSSKFDQNASIEGNIKKKNDFTFDFTNDEGKVELIYCEIHLKLLKNDYNATSTDRRIYFHEGKPHIQKGKILVGHIGNHL